MRSKTLEIRWHDTSPIFSSDFQPLPPHQLKKLLNNPSSSAPASSSSSSSSTAAGKEKEQIVAGGRSYRLATGGADNHVRLWLIHPNIPEQPSSAAGPSSVHLPPVTPPPPRAEFLATLKRHTASVNVVRWSPKEELLASAGDDGFVLLWVPKPTSSDGASSTAMPSSSSAFGDSGGAEEGQKEFWRVKMMVRPTTNEIYDLAWSPDGAHFVVGSTDNTAKIFDAASGSCIKAIADHSHYVQGVAWDPLNEFIATQSSDRAVHIHRIHQNKGELEFHPHNRSQKMEIHHSRTPSFSSSSSSTTMTSIRPGFLRRASVAASETDSVITSAASEHGDDNHSLPGASSATKDAAPLTPTASLPGTPSLANLSASMKPPSRRSSFSSSAAASPPPSFAGAFPLSSAIGPSSSRNDASRYGRSPSPLPAIRPPSSSVPTHPSSSHPRSTSTKIYGDESYTHYFRRLTFSPDGALLLTPAGQIDDQHLSFSTTTDESGKPRRTGSTDAGAAATGTGGSKPTVYIYSRANLHNSPIAHLPGQKTASVAVKFSPIFYELRDVGVATEAKTIIVDEKSGEDVQVSLGSSSSSSSSVTAIVPTPPASTSTSPRKPTSLSASQSTHLAGSPSPALPPVPTSPAPPPSVFALPYRMFFAVATQDAVLLYDTQQAGPIAIFVGLHYAGFTDLAWSPDGQTLVLSSIDGYCSTVVFDSSELGTLHPTQQHQKQLQTIAHNLSAPHPLSLPPSPALSHSTPSFAPAKVEELEQASDALASSSASKRAASDPSPAVAPATIGDALAAAPGAAKKKRRVELTHIGSLD